MTYDQMEHIQAIMQVDVSIIEGPHYKCANPPNGAVGSTSYHFHICDANTPAWHNWPYARKLELIGCPIEVHVL